MQTGHVNNSKYLNCFKTILALLYLKKGIADFCDEIADTFHKDVFARIKQKYPNAATTKCTTCNNKSAHKKNTKWRIQCPVNVCNIVLQEILPYHVNASCPNIAWVNSNPLRWASDFWEIAKLFQPYGCEKHTKAEDSDCVGLLTMMIYCRVFQQRIINTTVLQEIIDVRNKCMHSADMEISDTDMKNGLDLMISLLDEPELIQRTACKRAKQEILELRDITNSLSTQMITALFDEMSRKETEYQQLKSAQDAMSLRLDTTGEECNQMQKLIKENRECIETLNKISEQSVDLHEVEKRSLCDKLRTIETKLEDIAAKLKQKSMESVYVSSEVAGLTRRMDELENRNQTNASSP